MVDGYEAWNMKGVSICLIKIPKPNKNLLCFTNKVHISSTCLYYNQPTDSGMFDLFLGPSTARV